MDDVTISVYAGVRLSQVAHVRHLLVAPAAFGPLQVAMVDELVLTGVQVDVHLPGPCGGEAPCDSSPLDDSSLGILRILDLKGGLPLAGAKLLDVGWVLWRGQVPVARISAKQASVRRRGGALELREARLEHLTQGRVVEARRATWDPKTHGFAMGGGYVLREGGKRLAGERGWMEFADP
jgi:hypothetical protein